MISHTALRSTRDLDYRGLEVVTRYDVLDKIHYRNNCDTKTTTGNTILSWSYIRDGNDIIAQYDNTFHRHIYHRLHLISRKA